MKQYLLIATALLTAACGGNRQTGSGQASTTTAATETPTTVGPAFSADSAFAFCEAQCAFGPRIMNSEAHEQCGSWIARTFERYGLQVIEQRATLQGYDGTALKSNNIIAQYRPERQDRVLVCAHWDSRPWADNDPDPDHWHTPVMAANDGASGVAVMLELARLLALPETDDPNLGIDFVCFDAEDWGEPQWAETMSDDNTWALGAQYWAAHLHRPDYKARYGILLDMVGGRGARFYQESVSRHYAGSVVDRIWRAAETVGYSTYFPRQVGGAINDDHVPVNEVAHIPCVDIIHHTPDGGFGPTWHTVSDDMNHIDRSTLKAVGQTLVQVLFEK